MYSTSCDTTHRDLTILKFDGMEFKMKRTEYL